MQPICTDAGVQFTANDGGSDVTVSEPGNDYGCLGYSPNPSWYYLEVATAGDIVMSLSANTDIDFIIWGPFNNLAAAQAACGTYSNIVPDTGCDFLGIFCDAYGCSYSSSNTETPGIPNAQVGQVYVMLITNYANNVQDITLTQTDGTGATDCSIVTPTVCSITNLVANVSACDPATGNYTVSGTINFTNPPSSGNLIVQDCTGATHIAATAPFSSSGTASYSYTLPANGSACSVNAYFSVEPACSNGPITYTAPTCPTTPCYISNLEANISACNTDNSFTVDGIFSYMDNPGSGTVTVTVSNASGTQTQTFNPPFVDGQNYNYSVTMNSDGSPLTVTVTFSADPTCTMSLNSTSPANCTCAAQIGTFTVATDGTQNVNNISLCFGDVLDITANGDWTPAEEATDPATPEGYDPNIIWLVYSCPPSVAIAPDPALFITDDPCLLTLVNSPDLPEVNDMFWIDNLPPGTFTNNTVYFVPITAYNVSVNPLLISYTNTNLPCYQMGPVYAVQYIPEVTFTQLQDCPSGTVEATISGGLPSIDGSQFNAVAGSLLPATANFINTTAVNNGTITVGGLQNGDNYTFDIEDGNGCFITVSGTFVGGSTTTVSYPQPAYCEDETNPTPSVTGTPGGSFSSTSGLVINSSTGVINLQGSNAGTYTVTYTPPAGTCEASSTCTITIHALPNVNAGSDLTVCDGQTVILTATGANQYTWDNGIQNGISFTPTLGTTTYTVTGTSLAGCTNTDQVSVTATPIPTAGFTPDVTMGCVPLTVTFTNTSSGSTNCTWNFGDGTILNGCSSVTNTFTEEGCFDVTLTITSAGGCQATLSVPSLICVEEAPIAYFIPSTNTVTEFDNQVYFDNESTGAISYAWNFGDNSETSNADNPTHEYPVVEQGQGWTIQLIATSPMGCMDTTYATIFFQEELIFYVPNTFTPDDDDYNQTFQPVFTSGFDPYDFSMWIYNRWGELVFETHDATIGWDGSYGKNREVDMVQDGTYTWKIEFKMSRNDEHKWYAGHVNIIR
jgi:gliding motility-associated-like protein